MKFKIIIFLLLGIITTGLPQTIVPFSVSNEGAEPSNLKVFDNKLFFSAKNQNSLISIYYIQGVGNPIQIPSSFNFTGANEFTVVSDRLVFSTFNKAYFIKEGTTQIIEIAGNYSYASDFIEYNDYLYFIAKSNQLNSLFRMNLNNGLVTNIGGSVEPYTLLQLNHGSDLDHKSIFVAQNKLFFNDLDKIYFIDLSNNNTPSSPTQISLPASAYYKINNTLEFSGFYLGTKVFYAVDINSSTMITDVQLLVIDLNSIPTASIVNKKDPVHFISFNGFLFFTALNSTGNSYVMWYYHPNAGFTETQIESDPQAFIFPSAANDPFRKVGNNLFHKNMPITLNGNMPIFSQPIGCITNNYPRNYLLELNNKYYYSDFTNNGSFEVFSCSLGTNQIQETCLNGSDNFFHSLITYQNKLYFSSGYSSNFVNKLFRWPEDPSGGLCNQNTDFSISGITYEDINNNGVKENNEPAIPGVTVLFTNGSGSISDIDGNYSLANQQTGNYIIKAIAPLGYSATLPINGETTISLPYNGASINFGFKKDCPHPDYIALRDLYNATNGSQWTNTITGDNPWLVDCDPCGLIDGTPWKGIQCTNMGRVDVINLSNNNLVGSLPASIGQLTELEWFNVNRNNLSGSLPSEICNLNRMLHFVISNNMFSGNFPACFANLTSLSRIVANNNKFTGALPILGGTTQPDLINLHFDNNMFNGSIPSNYGNLPNLNYLAVANNDLSGCYSQVLSIFCSDPDFTSNTNALISDGNSFNASWSQFCATGAGSCTVSISDQDLSNITVYPNPVLNKLFINIIGNKSSFDFKVYDNTGRQQDLKSLDLQNGINSLDVSLLPPGIYFLRIGTKEYHKFTKFIKID